MTKGTIEINDLRLYCFHGLSDQERQVGNWFEVTVHLEYPFAARGEYDDINSTLNYAEVISIIREIMDHPVRIIETAAVKIKKSLINRYPKISGGYIRVSKLLPPVRDIEIASVAVTLEW